MELVKLCRKTGTKVPVKIPSDLDGKWSKAQKLIWPVAKVEEAQKSKECCDSRGDNHRGSLADAIHYRGRRKFEQQGSKHGCRSYRAS